MHALAPTLHADLRALLDSLGEKASGERPRRERVLEQLLDLKRCVSLDNVLAELRSADARSDLAQPNEAQLARLRLLEGTLIASLRQLREQIDRRFANMTSGTAAASSARAPDAAALVTWLEEHEGKGAPAARSAAMAAEKVASHASKRYVAVVDGVLEALLKELGRRRHEVQLALQEGSAEVERLGALDRELDDILRAELDHARVQLATRLGTKLEAALRDALVTLPTQQDAPSALSLRAVFLPSGAIGRFQHDARRLCHALLDLEWSALMGLLQAAMQAEPRSDLEKAEP